MFGNSCRRLIAGAGLLLWLSRTVAAEWQNSLKPAGPVAANFPLVEAGQPAAGILCTDNPMPQDQAAAEELQSWIKELTGATLPIYFGGAPGRNLILRTDSRLGDDGYSITYTNRQVLLWGGRTRGLMNGVFALLEEDLGCRFYTSNSVRLPKTNTLILPVVNRRYIPQLRLRDPFYACAFDPAWSLRNRTSAPRAAVPEKFGGHLDYANLFVHTATQMVPSDKHFKAHPEYFAQRTDGSRDTAQLCATEPAVAQLTIAYIRQALADHPQTEIVSVSKNDNTVVCECERCRELRAREGSEMANQLVLVNRVAEALEKDFPRLTIDTLAYQNTLPVPKTARPRRNVAIRFCNDSPGAWSRPFTPAEKCDIAQLAKAWAAVHDRIYVWDYNVNFSHYLAPMPNLDVIAANIRFWVKQRAEGVMLQGGYQGPAERDELKSWVASKLLWDPSLDERALAQDFIEGHYGAAAPALADYEALLEKLRGDQAAPMARPAGGIRYPMTAPFFTDDFIDRANQIFARAKKLAADDASLLLRVERAELPLLYLQCQRGPKSPGPDYAQIVGDFERIARREQVQYLREGPPDLEEQLKLFRQRIAKPSNAP